MYEEVRDQTHEDKRPMVEVSVPQHVESLDEKKERQQKREIDLSKSAGRKKGAKTCCLI